MREARSIDAPGNAPQECECPKEVPYLSSCRRLSLGCVIQRRALFTKSPASFDGTSPEVAVTRRQKTAKKVGDNGNPSPSSPGNTLLFHCRIVILNRPFCITSLSSSRRSVPAGFPVALAASLRRTGYQLMCREVNTSTTARPNSSKPSMSPYFLQAR